MRGLLGVSCLKLWNSALVDGESATGFHSWDKCLYILAGVFHPGPEVLGRWSDSEGSGVCCHRMGLALGGAFGPLPLGL